MSRSRPTSSTTSSSVSKALAAGLPLVVDGEHRARKGGRIFAKEIFQSPQQWKIIGTHPGDHVEIFESVAPPPALTTSSTSPLPSSARSVRAVRKLRGSIDDVEDVLRATHTSQLYAKLLPELYASGGCIADYGLVRHDTNEREYTNVQFAIHHAHFWNQSPSDDKPPASKKAPEQDHHLFLEYTLATQLQRTQVAVLPDGTTSTVSKPVPSLLYVLRPVVVPSFSDRHAEFEAQRLAQNKLSVTYIVQQEENDKLSLEVMLTCAFQEPELLASVRASNTSEMWRFVVALTRLQPLIDAVRNAREATERRTTPTTRTTETAVLLTPRRATDAPSPSPSPVADRSSTRAKVKGLFSHHRERRKHSGADTASDSEDDWDGGENITGGCAACHKKFHAFRWKKRCEVCLRAVCDPCLSTITNPSAMRKKKRVCGPCLYGGTNSGFDRVTGAADFARDAELAARDVLRERARARTDATLPRAPATRTHASASDTADRASRRYTATTPDASRRRAQTSAARPPNPPPPPPPVAQPNPVASHRTAPIMLTPPSPTNVDAPRPSEEPADFTKPVKLGVDATELPPYKSNSFFDETDPSGIVSDDEFVVAGTTRSRRAQTIEIGDVSIKRVEKTRRHSRAAEMLEPPKSEPSIRARGRSFSNDHSDVTPLDLGEFELRLSKKNAAETTAVAPKRSTMQFRQLKTPPIKYDLDFDWFNPFPKAPIPQGTKELERIEYMASQLKLNAHTAMVYLRRDAVLEELTQTVVGSLATQWDGCSIHLIGERQVFCLAYSYQEPLPVSYDAVQIVVEDVIAREECASSYALYHQAAFFVPDLSKDDRFRAHPIHTDAHVVSYLSLPIYTEAGSRSCIGTMDLWRLDPSGVSSHISQDWWIKMERVLTKVAARIEELSLSHAGHMIQSFTKTRSNKARSVGSSTDSRSSTRKEDLDLHDLMEEQVLQDDPIPMSTPLDDSDTEYELNGWTSSPVEAVLTPPSSARPRRHTVADQFDLPQSSGSFTDSRSSSSSLNLESTIESLLNQAKRTSQYVRRQSQVHA